MRWWWWCLWVGGSVGVGTLGLLDTSWSLPPSRHRHPIHRPLPSAYTPLPLRLTGLGLEGGRCRRRCRRRSQAR
ncbi:hypothetical protein B0H34DRAFT_709484 [Crassisporium funariophilum]|nr:hypothetical protein B0H34DRAFT_709484 [Crassisporium funariophilum]